jgi:hypothetical protein
LTICPHCWAWVAGQDQHKWIHEAQQDQHKWIHEAQQAKKQTPTFPNLWREEASRQVLQKGDAIGKWKDAAKGAGPAILDAIKDDSLRAGAGDLDLVHFAREEAPALFAAMASSSSCLAHTPAVQQPVSPSLSPSLLSELSRATAWRWSFLAYLSTQPSVVYSSAILMHVGLALTIYAALRTAVKVLAELRQRLGEDTNLRYNMGKLKIYIPGITRNRARELVLKFINQDPLLESLRELYDKEIAEPELDIINVTGMTCVGVPMGSPEFVTAFVRSKAKILQQDVQHRP